MKKSHFFLLTALSSRVVFAQPPTAPVVTAPAVAPVPAPVGAPVAVLPKPEPLKVAPFHYILGTATHILPETHTDESGYFSLIEGADGKIYIGTAKYQYNAFLVEFDPKTGAQRIVVDTNKVNGLTATGYAAQSKIHTRNFLAPSGKIYCGSQEGYRTIKGDTQEYPGGYVMVYDPKTDKAESLGMPLKGEGVIDVVADEDRGLLYVCTTLGEDKTNHWLVGDIKTKQYRELDVAPINYASTLLGADGKAHFLSSDFKLATYDPQTDKITLRDIQLDGADWKDQMAGYPPTWRWTPDGHSAYFVGAKMSSLLRLEFNGDGPVKAENLGSMLEGKEGGNTAALSVAPDGRVYALFKTHNSSGFGGNDLHHLTRYDPKTQKTQDLGVLKVQNPDFFDFSPLPDGKKKPWTHGYQTLPDGSLVPFRVHQGLIAAQDGSLYALILYPYTLFHIAAQEIP